MNSILKTAIALVGAMLVSNVLLAGTSNPPPPQPITCAGGNAVTGFSYGTLPTCGTPIAGGTINTGTAGQLTDYTAATAVSPIATGTGVVTALGVNTGSAGAFVVNGGDAGTPSALVGTNATGTAAGLTAGHVTTNANLTGDLTSVGNATTLANTAVTPGSYTNTNLTVDAKGRITAASTGTGGGGTIASTTSALAGDGAGNAVAVTGTGTNCVLVNGSSGACSGGGATGFGVDGGTSSAAVTTTGIVANGTRLEKIGSLAGAITRTLPAISAVSADTAICFADAGLNVGATNTLTIAANAADSIGGGATGNTYGPLTNGGSSACFRVSATHNWTVESGSSIAASNAPTNQFANGVDQNGLKYAQPAVADLSGFGTGVATAAAANLSAAGGLTSTIASGSQALNTAAISSATCDTVVSPTATNVATTDVVTASFNGDPSAVTGYIPATAGMLTILVYPTSGHVNFKVCNNTAGSITPGAITLNWRVAR